MIRYLSYVFSSLNRFLSMSPPPRDGRAHFLVILAAFFMMGLHVGVWAVLLADLAGALGLTPGVLGIALTFQAGAGVVGLLVGGRLIDRLGRRPILVLGIAGTGMYLVLLAFVGSYAGLLAVLVFSGVVGLYDLAVNSLGGDHERQHGGRVMTPLHAGFSGGAALGAFLSGLALDSGVGFRTVYVVTGLALLVLASAATRLPLPRHLSSTDAPPVPSGSSTRVVFVPVVFACVLLIFVSFSTDAALEGFISIYLRDVLGAGALLGGLGITALYLAGTIGRLASAAFLRLVGERRLLIYAGAVATGGIALVLATDRASVAAAGLLFVGIALSPVAPVAFSLTARATPGRSGQAISVVTVSGYLAFTLSPFVIGGLADLSSLRAAFLLLAVFTATIAVLSWRMPEPDAVRRTRKAP